ncbi:hypothetical protein cyc_00766 [Cyclospora cayetanensis]|uniref:AP2-coincident C-terminal domain-containing protein n=1 Tax=Cyclospora cayetanensis TaxID=88456 RepID=A0A1D3CV17_9EIME|nr:hypothetical protein cyc_00766 [Cyclospora cayetanensis]
MIDSSSPQAIMGLVKGVPSLHPVGSRPKQEAPSSQLGQTQAQLPHIAVQPPENFVGTPSVQEGGVSTVRKRQRGVTRAILVHVGCLYSSELPSGASALGLLDAPFCRSCGGTGEPVAPAVVTGEALLAASATEATRLAQKAEGLTQVWGIGTLTGIRPAGAESSPVKCNSSPCAKETPAVTEPSQASENHSNPSTIAGNNRMQQKDDSKDCSYVVPLVPKPVFVREHAGNGVTGASACQKTAFLASHHSTWEEASSTDCTKQDACGAAYSPRAAVIRGPDKTEGSLYFVAPNRAVNASNNCSILHNNGSPRSFLQLKEEVPVGDHRASPSLFDDEQQRLWSPGPLAFPRRKEALQPLHSDTIGKVGTAADHPIEAGSVEQRGGARKAFAAEALFETLCSDRIEQVSPDFTACQPEEMKLARIAVLICLADLRDICIPMVLVHPIDRKRHRKRVELHMVHVQECGVMQQLKPYMHLFELAFKAFDPPAQQACLAFKWGLPSELKE